MAVNEPTAALEIAATWARTLRGLRDPGLQVGWVREQLAKLGAARAADVLTIVLARAEQREEPYAVLLLRVSLALTAPALQGVKRAIACSAEARQQLSLARFFGADAPRAAEAAEDDEARIEVSASTSREPSRERPLSLGERKSLARRRDRTLLARVLRDPHPDVVQVLLDNPAITELDIVRLCARRPIRPDVLLQVFRHPRWIVRHRIRLTLALNPQTPEDITLQLLPHLSGAERRELARSGDLSERVRMACSMAPRGSLH